MNKIVRLLVGAVIAAVFMYIIGFIIALILTIIIVVVIKIVDKYRPEWSEWTPFRKTQPLITFDENGKLLYQCRIHYQRVNRKTGAIETKLVTDTVKRRVNEATSFEDIYRLQHYNKLD